MRSCHALRLAPWACVLAALALPAAAQVAGAAPAAAVAAPAVAAPPPAADEAAATRRTPEPKVQRIVSEDDNVRIDELRVRGQTREIVVQHKAISGSRYEILPDGGGRDPSSQDGRGAGQRVWRLFSF
jgi:3-oxoacyl-ACP reductase-like protein